MDDLKIQYLGFKESEAVSAVVQNHVNHLAKLTDQLMSCHVVISRPHRRKQQGNVFQVKLRLHLPGSVIVIDKDPGKNHAHEDVYVTIRDAFLAAKRKLEDFNRIRSGRVKEHAGPFYAKILRLLPEQDCGFVLSEDRREIYFHRNALFRGAYEDLKLGQKVRFSEALGEKGPQVTSMELVGHSG